MNIYLILIMIYIIIGAGVFIFLHGKYKYTYPYNTFKYKWILVLLETLITWPADIVTHNKLTKNSDDINKVYLELSDVIEKASTLKIQDELLCIGDLLYDYETNEKGVVLSIDAISETFSVAYKDSKEIVIYSWKDTDKVIKTI